MVVSKIAIGACVALLIGCGASVAPTSTPTSGPKVIQTEGLKPTPTSIPTPTPQPTYTPYPTPDIEAMVNERLNEIMARTPTLTPTPEPTPTATPVPTRTPTPTPEPLVRPVTPPESDALANVLTIRSISMQGRTLKISGYVEGKGYEPTVIQVWHAYDSEPYSETCSTERPVAFVLPGNGSVVYSGQTSPYTWSFCQDGYRQSPITDQVPWIYSQSWDYSLRERIRTSDPYIYDLNIRANLDHERVERLEYSSGVASGWRVIIWSKERIIASRWIDY